MQSSESAVHSTLDDMLAIVSKCTIPGRLYDCGRYPALKDGDLPIEGELYKIIDWDILKILDEHESIDNFDTTKPGFTRKSVLLINPIIEAWVYYYDGDIYPADLIDTNRWSD